jgi:DNA-binding MarR family transcriptional regulator
LRKLFLFRDFSVYGKLQSISFEGGDRKMASQEAGSETQTDALVLAENLRATLGRFVRRVKTQANTPTTSQSETLSLLDRAGPLSVAELAGRRNVRHQSMRLVAGQLESEGLISKMPNPVDGRSRLLSITDKGRAQLSRAREARTLQIANVIEERLSDKDRRTLEAAIRVIERLC